MPTNFRNGTPGNDTLNGTAIKDVMHGLAGNDVLNGLAGVDSLYGDSGNDLLNGGDDGDWLIGGFGADVLHGGKGYDTLKGFEQGYPDTAGNRLYGEEGNDYLYLYGNVTFRDKGWGGPGNDSFTFYGKGALGYGEAGDDFFYNTVSGLNGGLSKGGTAFIYGGPGADTFWIAGYDRISLKSTFVDWQPGVDILAGWVGNGATEIVPFVRQHFDVNHDGHVDIRDGQQFTAEGHSLTFPINPLTGTHALTLQIYQQVLYLPNTDQLF